MVHAPFKPDVADPSNRPPESKNTTAIIEKLNLLPHPEGGYYAETDRDTLRVPNPFKSSTADGSDETRSASTTIYYYLTPHSPLGHFHRNKARTVHTLHKGRGQYVIIHADEVAATTGADANSDKMPEAQLWTGKARLETFVVGQDVAAGEKLQWIVEGGKYKASFLLPDDKNGKSSKEGVLISETVVPGFEFADHDFLEKERCKCLVTEEQAGVMEWLVREG